MDAASFSASLTAAAPPPALAPLLEALWHDGRGAWDKAHAIVQAQAGTEAAMVHAYLHRKEGDLANADYWYQRAGRPRPACDVQAEWTILVRELLDSARGQVGGET